MVQFALYCIYVQYTAFALNKKFIVERLFRGGLDLAGISGKFINTKPERLEFGWGFIFVNFLNRFDFATRSHDIAAHIEFSSH